MLSIVYFFIIYFIHLSLFYFYNVCLLVIFVCALQLLSLRQIHCECKLGNNSHSDSVYFSLSCRGTKEILHCEIVSVEAHVFLFHMRYRTEAQVQPFLFDCNFCSTVQLGLTVNRQVLKCNFQRQNVHFCMFGQLKLSYLNIFSL